MKKSIVETEASEVRAELTDDMAAARMRSTASPGVPLALPDLQLGLDDIDLGGFAAPFLFLRDVEEVAGLGETLAGVEDLPLGGGHSVVVLGDERVAVLVEQEREAQGLGEALRLHRHDQGGALPLRHRRP